MQQTSKELHGVDLDEWTYLGFTTLKYKKPEKMKSYVLFFSAKGDEDYGLRHYIHVGEDAENMKNHEFLVINAELWKAGEYEFAAVIETEPSLWLIEKMQELNGLTWDWEFGWISIGDDPHGEDEKYARAVEEQKKPKKNPRDFKVLTFAKKKVEPENATDGQDISEE